MVQENASADAYALESFDLTSYDLVISSESGPAKGIVPAPEAFHVCYCHSPMRYIWDMYYQYRDSLGPLSKAAMPMLASPLRRWDVTTSNRVDSFVANSQFVAQRIQKYYRRNAPVIYPPVDIERFEIAESVSDTYICVGPVAPNKRTDLAIQSFARLGKKLLIIGNGSPALRKMAPSNVTFSGSISNEKIARIFSRCKALIFCGIEDFGILPVEVMACGRPIIAYARGGILETVVDRRSGILFHEQTVASVCAAVEEFEAWERTCNPAMIRASTYRFGAQRFTNEIESFITRSQDEYATQMMLPSTEIEDFDNRFGDTLNDYVPEMPIAGHREREQVSPVIAAIPTIPRQTNSANLAHSRPTSPILASRLHFTGARRVNAGGGDG